MKRMTRKASNWLTACLLQQVLLPKSAVGSYPAVGSTNHHKAKLTQLRCVCMVRLHRSCLPSSRSLSTFLLFCLLVLLRHDDRAGKLLQVLCAHLLHHLHQLHLRLPLWGFVGIHVSSLFRLNSFLGWWHRKQTPLTWNLTLSLLVTSGWNTNKKPHFKDWFYSWKSAQHFITIQQLVT